MRAVLYGTAVVGTLDALDAMVFAYAVRGSSPARMFQGIASGLLGRASFDGGWATALLGASIHVFIAFAVVAVFVLASRWLPVLRRRPLLCGALYGIAVYGFMNLVVIPLSAIGPLPYRWPQVANGLAIHVLAVGLPAAWFAARVPRPADAPSRAVASGRDNGAR
jgi:hypothetical protein